MFGNIQIFDEKRLDLGDVININTHSNGGNNRYDENFNYWRYIGVEFDEHKNTLRNTWSWRRGWDASSIPPNRVWLHDTMHNPWLLVYLNIQQISTFESLKKVWYIRISAKLPKFFFSINHSSKFGLFFFVEAHSSKANSYLSKGEIKHVRQKWEFFKARLY